MAGLATTSGRRYQLFFRTEALSDPTNGGENNFYVGPMFIDAVGKIVGWYKEQPPISVLEGSRAGVIDVIAPHDAVSVHISIQGNHAKNVSAGNGVIAFSELRLVEV